MKKTILSLLLAMICTSIMASQPKTVWEDVSGEFEVTYQAGLIFKKEKSFKITYFEPEEGKPGDVVFNSKEFGTCDNVNNLGGRADYGYVHYSSREILTRISGVEEVTYIQSTIFCDINGEKNYYIIYMEAPLYAFENSSVGDTFKGGVAIKDSSLELVLDKKVTIKRLK